MARIATMRTRGAVRRARQRAHHRPCSATHAQHGLSQRAKLPVAASITQRMQPPGLSTHAAETYTAHRSRHAGGSVQHGLSDAMHHLRLRPASDRRLINAIRSASQKDQRAAQAGRTAPVLLRKPRMTATVWASSYYQGSIWLQESPVPGSQVSRQPYFQAHRLAKHQRARRAVHFLRSPRQGQLQQRWPLRPPQC